MKRFLVVLLAMAMLVSISTAAWAAQVKDPKDMTIYFITKVIGNAYWSVVEQGAKDAAADLGLKNLVVTGVPSEADVEKQIELLQNAVSAKADAICLGPVDSTAMAGDVSAAFKTGIPIIIVDTMINTDDYTMVLITDNVAAGSCASVKMLKLLKESGLAEDKAAQVAIQVGSIGSQTILDRLKGFNEHWAQHAPKAWVVLNNDVKVNDGDISKAVGFAQDFLTTYPNLKAVFGPNNGSTVGFVIGLKEANRTDIAMIGFDFSKEIESMIREGNFTVATVVQMQYRMGYDGVVEGVKAAQGIAPKEKYVDTGVFLVDKNNIDEPQFEKVIYPTGKPK